jgi:hypothetical protein
VDEDVTSWVVPSDREAVAVSCEVPPAAGADPLTVIVETELEPVVVSPHAAANPAKATATTNATNDDLVKTRRGIVMTLIYLAALRARRCRGGASESADVTIARETMLSLELDGDPGHQHVDSTIRGHHRRTTRPSDLADDASRHVTHW